MRQKGAAVIDMTEHNSDAATERYERRLGEECGKLRVETQQVRLEIGELRVEMAKGFGEQGAATASLRAEMIDRNAELLQWLLAFWVTTIGIFVASLFAR